MAEEACGAIATRMVVAMTEAARQSNAGFHTLRARIFRRWCRADPARLSGSPRGPEGNFAPPLWVTSPSFSFSLTVSMTVACSSVRFSSL
jgi:hypothetical protein